MNELKKEQIGASKTKSDVKGRYTVSQVFPDGSIADMMYSRNTFSGVFAITRGDDSQLLDEPLVGQDGNLTLDVEKACFKLVPTKVVRDLVDKNFINLASGLEAYGTVQELYNQIREHIQKYVVLEDVRFYDVATGYVLMSWVFDRFNTVPYLRVVGDLGTGKSRFLEVVGKLCNRSMMASGSISMAAVFRTLDLVQGTLVFDEADFKSSDMSDDIVKILNGGHKKDTPVVRMELVNDVLKPTSFRVFGPKILGSRRSFGDTALESRCITQRLFPMRRVEVPVHLPPTFETDSQMFRNKLQMFRLNTFHRVKEDESSLLGLEFPRLKQTALALTSIVKMVGDEQLKSVLGFLVDYEKSLLDSVSTDIFADILLCIAQLMEFDEYVKKSGVIHMNTIANAFNKQFYDDHAERETRTVNTRDGVLSIPGQRVSARKIGSYVDKLGIAKMRDGHGVCIPLISEAPRIMQMVERHGLMEILSNLRKEEDYKKTNPTKVPISTFVETTDAPF